MEKSPIFLGAVGNVNGETGVSLALNKEHTRQRRALGYLFTNSALLQLENILRIHVHKFVDTLETMAAERRPVNCADWCKRY
jgi:cytochrome P450